ncbi:hypothetical protein ACUMKS_003543 [Proteus mirabilis]|uniref:hypothetical protein n=1 Tax=Proteus mirabilis TaxID=584 RepID=UPI001A30CD4F|nr:hypothetical protein [Proteus mirabilis]HEM8286024.1 hypothetical protein [Providencia stuartii]MBI6253053.1 hypothetical protein [Proteus mirabilis]MBI6290348.1 hypothetical protein [Proteus mirabilis]MDN3789819.1 hypothetical protein [Proteus mirabilis]HEJ9553616.1 hypothetical protein [Proteus mirabilis]
MQNQDIFSDDFNENSIDNHHVKKESPLKKENKREVKQSFLSKYWTYLVIGLVVIGFISIGLYEPSNNSVSNENTVNQIIESEQDNSFYDEPFVTNDTVSFDTDKIEQLSKVMLEQKNEIESLKKQNEQFKIALIQHKEAINQLKNDISIKGNEANKNSDSKNINTKYSPNVQLKDMSLNDITMNLAWVKYKGKTYAVAKGDNLGGVTVISINPIDRIVITNKGLIK